MGNLQSASEDQDWVQDVISDLAPGFTQVLRDMFTDDVESAINEGISGLEVEKEESGRSGKFKFTKLDFGSQAPKLGNVVKRKTKHGEGDRKIVLDFDFCYDGDCDIEVTALGVKSGVTGCSLSARARVIMAPVIKRMPFIGGAQFQFLSLPDIGYDFTGLADVADLPGVKRKIRKSLEKEVSKKLVYPHRASFPMCGSCDPSTTTSLSVTGLLGVKLSVAGLPSKGGLRKVFKQGAPDVFCKLTVGSLQQVTEVVRTSTSAEWDNWFQFPLEVAQGHTLIVEVWDADSFSRDDFLGHVSLVIDSDNTTDINEEALPLQEHPLKSTKQDVEGMVNISTQWNPLRQEQTSEAACDQSCCGTVSVFVYTLNRVFQVGEEESKTKLKVSFDSQVKKSQKLKMMENCKVEEMFVFLLQSNWAEKEMSLEVGDKVLMQRNLEELMEIADTKTNLEVNEDGSEGEIVIKFEFRWI